MLNKWMGMIPNASEHGLLIDHLLEFCHWFMLVLFVGWLSYFFFAIFRFHRSRNPKANYHGVKSKFATHAEFMVIMIEAVLLLGFGLPLWGKRVTEDSFPDKKDALRIHAVGEQFLWTFHYPGPDGIFGQQNVSLVSSNNPLGLDMTDPAGKDDIVTTNELHLVKGKPTVIEITSKDVIHSLSLHSMRVTQDATPGSRVPVWFRPNLVGTYEIVCAQLCGMNHYAMKASMEVHEQADWDAWFKQTADNSKAKKDAAAAAATPAP